MATQRHVILCEAWALCLDVRHDRGYTAGAGAIPIACGSRLQDGLVEVVHVVDNALCR